MSLILEFPFTSKLTLEPVSRLQAATVYNCTADEELPEDYVPEILMRVGGTNGYFNAVFTATIGQVFWANVVSPPNEKI